MPGMNDVWMPFPLALAALVAANIAFADWVLPSEIPGWPLYPVLMGTLWAVTEHMLLVLASLILATAAEAIASWWREKGSRVRLQQIGAVVAVFASVLVLCALALRAWPGQRFPPSGAP